MDNLGAIGGPLLALGLVALTSVRTAILISFVPGALAALAIVVALGLRGLPRGAPLWAELEATPTLARRVHEELHAFQGALTSGRAVNLVRLHNTLKEAREAIG